MESTATRTGYATLSGYAGVVCLCGRVSPSERAHSEHVRSLPELWQPLHKLIAPKAEVRV